MKWEILPANYFTIFDAAIFFKNFSLDNIDSTRGSDGNTCVITGNTTLCSVSIFVTVFSLFVTGCCFVSSLARFLSVGMGGF